MCGRYTLAASVEDISRHFDLPDTLPDLTPSYNIAPGRDVAVVVAEEGRRSLKLLRWGLVPFWADDPEIGRRMINARAETAPEKPAFRAAFRERRCLIPATGFYEWQRAEGGKQPFHARLVDGGLFAFAGLWERWSNNGDELLSATILTTEPNELMAEMHHRMPVIVEPRNYGAWLESSVEEARQLLVPYPSAEMEAYAVSRAVNNPSNDSPRVIEAATGS